jgi:hypothetical protein
MIGAASTVHNHDDLYYRKNQFADTSLTVAFSGLSVDGWRNPDPQFSDSGGFSVNGSGERIIIKMWGVPGIPVGTSTPQWVLGLTNDTVRQVTGAEVRSFADAEPSIVAGTTSQFWRGDKTWQALTSAYISDIINGTADLNIDDITADSADLRIAHVRATTPRLRLTDTDASGPSTSVGWVEWYHDATLYGSVGFLSGDMYIKNRLTGDIIFGTDDSEKARLTSAGRFGLGVDAPSTALHVSNANAIITLTDNDAADNTAALPYLRFGRTDSLLMGYVGYGSTSNTDLYLRNLTATGNINLRNGSYNNLVAAPDGSVSTANDLSVGDDLEADSISGRVVKVPGDTSFSTTVTLKDGSTTRATGTAYIARDAQRRLCYVSLPGLIGTIKASTTTTLTFSTGVIVAPVAGASVNPAPLRSATIDIVGVLWVKNDNKIELHTSNPWGYLAAGTGGVVETTITYRY